MPLKTTFKLGAIAACSLGLTGAVQALPITGTISFFGDVTAVTSTAPGAPVVSNGDFTQAHALRFGVNQYVAAGPSGSFAGVVPNTIATMYSPLQINSPVLPPPGQPLWTVSDKYGDTFIFTLSTLTEPLTTPTVMILSGTGTIHEQVAAGSPISGSDNTGTWTATFNSAAAGPYVTFNWSSSSQFSAVPEVGSSFLMMGLGLASIGAFSRFRKAQAA